MTLHVKHDNQRNRRLQTYALGNGMLIVPHFHRFYANDPHLVEFMKSCKIIQLQKNLIIPVTFGGMLCFSAPGAKTAMIPMLFHTV